MRRRWQWAASLGLMKCRRGRQNGAAAERQTSSTSSTANSEENVEPIPTMDVEERGDSFWAGLKVYADKVLPHLFIGNYSSGASKSFLEENKITRVLNMTMEPHSNRIPGIEYLNLGLNDVSGADISVFFDDAHKFLSQARLEGTVALVHCHMGISRATTITMSHILLSGQIHDCEEEHARNAEEFQLNSCCIPAGKLEAAIVAHEEKQVLLTSVWPVVVSRRKCASPNDGFFRHLELLEMRLTGSGKPSMDKSCMWNSQFAELRYVVD